MVDAAVLCTGPSMSAAVAESVRGMVVIAVNATFRLAPWADAVVANDAAWWKEHPDVQQFAGRKFSASGAAGVEMVEPRGVVPSSFCSGVAALQVAKMLGATRIFLLGADMAGGHYFGDYVPPLNNPTAARIEFHKRQFRAWGEWNPRIPVINCTPGSALQCFPHSTLEAELC